MSTPDPNPETNPVLLAMYDTVYQSPFVFGRVMKIAAFWGPATEPYQSERREPFLVPEAQEPLRKLHAETFTKWLTLPLKLQKADITVYLNLFDARERPAKLDKLLEVAEQAVPARVILAERQLFLRDLRIVKALVRYDL
jgi:hypothetical protein